MERSAIHHIGNDGSLPGAGAPGPGTAPSGADMPAPRAVPGARRSRPITGRRLLIAATVVVALLAIVTAFHDVPAVAAALRDFDWRLLPLALSISTVMHGLRFARWHLYARRVAGPALRRRDSLVIFGAGMGTHLTPGRMGEAVRCAFLRRAAGTPVARSAPIILAERVTDGVGLLGLALPGALALHLGGRLIASLLLLPLVIVPLLASTRAHRTVLALLDRTPLLRRYARALAHASDELRGLMGLRVLAVAGLLSLASVALEVAVFTLALTGVGLDFSADTYVRAAFILPSAMLASAIFLVPGNLGVAEGGMAALTRTTLGAAAAPAAAAAVLVRVFTLWWGVTLGSLALGIATRRWGRGE